MQTTIGITVTTCNRRRPATKRLGLSAAALAAAGLLAVAAAPSAHASFLTGAFSVHVTTGYTSPAGQGVPTTNTDQYTGANAQFTYTGPIGFDNTAGQNNGPSGDLNSAFGFSSSNISGYSGSGTVGGGTIADFSSVGSFVASSGSASNYQYGSWYSFDLGNLASGTTLTITHDDGVSVYQGDTNLGGTTEGPTTATTDTLTLLNSGDTILYYTRQNGTPSILEVSASNVPEPTTLAIIASGLLGMTITRRNRRSTK